jgi:hypothetical protein
MPDQSEPTLALTGMQVGTVETITEGGAGLSLVLRLVGRMNGRGPEVAQRVAVHPSELAEFLRVLNAAVRQHFPDHVPPSS